MHLAGVEKTLETFRSAFEAGRHGEWSELYDTSVVLMRPHQTLVCDGPTEMLAIGKNVHETYSKLGLARIEMDLRDVRSFEHGIVMADVRWRYQTMDREEIIRFDCTYGLRRRAGGYKISLHIPHNEAVRRPMFLETADPDLLIGGEV